MIFIMPGLDSREAMKSYNAARYHKPADDVLNPDGFLGRRYGRVSAR